jgi:two-component sensor histidine kinase
MELGNRIRSMALVHEMLYQSGNLNRIDFQEYLQTLVAHLRHAFDPEGAIRIEVAAAGVQMDLDAAIPCGLIVNELMINALKYAFPPDRRREASACQISVAAVWDGAAYTLTVTDNGVGLPASLDWATTRTLGLRLVRMLGQHQLGGQLELHGAHGTCFSLQFGSKIR